jgi:hypothetical protein
MTTSFLEYHLQNGFVHNWLVAGPLAQPITVESSPVDVEHLHQHVLQSLPEESRAKKLDLDSQPVENQDFELDGAPLTWRYVRCMDDHLVDRSGFYPLWQHLSAWAYTELKLPAAQSASFVITTQGPAKIWLNGKVIHSNEEFHPDRKVSCSVPVDLVEGVNQVLVSLETVGVRACPLTLAMQVTGLPEEIEKGLKVTLATLARNPRRHETLEEVFEMASLDEVVNHWGAHTNLRWAKHKGPMVRFSYHMLDKDRFDYVEGTGESDTENPLDVGHGFHLRERAFFLTIQPVILEYFEHNLRYEKQLPIHVLDTPYASTPAGTFEQRLGEALQAAAKHETHLFAQIANLALGRWTDFKAEVLLEEMQKVNRREAGSQVSLLGLLGIAYRYMNAEQFPESLKQPLEDCVLNFSYWPDETQPISQTGDSLVFSTESDSLILHACETLAGQLYPQHMFSSSGQKGERLHAKGQERAINWLHQRGKYGFQEWDSNETFEKDILALSHLTSLAEDTLLSELSAVMMDKIFFSMAVNSYRGSYGSTHGRTSASMIRSSQLEATSGISRMLWGTGVYNHHILGTVSLATSTYEFPLLIGEIANDQSVVLSKERHVVDAAQGREVNKVTYKTPDYMLSSAQDYRPGEPGTDEHIWQATLGSDAVVFSNHPASISNAETQRPGFWLGNQTLPRVAQWKDLLVAVYHLPDDDWMGFTHAFFPVYQFSAHEIITNEKTGRTWAFARKDNGYLALTALQGFELIQRAPDGNRELRSYGQNNIWVCQMGRAETDGNFQQFKKRVQALKMDFQGLEVHSKTLRGDYLTFGWEGPLRINGNEKPLHGFKHHESPYSVVDFPATRMDIQSNGTVMRLDFS